MMTHFSFTRIFNQVFFVYDPTSLERKAIRSTSWYPTKDKITQDAYLTIETITDGFIVT